jgi:hypothetical protein
MHCDINVKLDLVCKARFVAGGHQTDPPKELVYSIIVSRDSVCLAFLIVELNDLEILSAEVQNAYLNDGMIIWWPLSRRLASRLVRRTPMCG